MQNLKKNSVTSLTIFLPALVFFGFNPDYMLIGDSLYYANFIRNGQFDTLTLHNGYYVIGYLLNESLGYFMDVELDRLLVQINIVFGALGLVIAYWLANDFFDSRKLSLVCTLVLFLCGRYFINATSAEIYIQQTFFTLLSFHLFMTRRLLLSGFAFLAALFITPLSIFSFLFFPVVHYLRKYRRLDFAWFLAPVVLIYGVFLLYYHEELLFGTRGLLVISEQKDFSPEIVPTMFMIYQFKHYFLLVILALFGCAAVLRKREFLYSGLAVVLPHIYVISKLTTEDHVFILTTDFFFSALVACGAALLCRSRRTAAVPVLLLAVQIGVQAYSQSWFDGEDRSEYRDQIRAIYHDFLAGENALLITDWSQRMALSYYTGNGVKAALESGDAYHSSFDAAHLNEQFFAVAEHTNKSLYVLETYEPGRLADLLLNERDRELRRDNNSLRTLVQHTLKVRCQLVRPGIRDLFQCARPAL